MRLTGVCCVKPAAYGTTPEDVITTLRFGAPESVPTFSTALTTSMPLTTSPNTTCLPSSHEVTSVVMKNCYPHARIVATQIQFNEKAKNVPEIRWCRHRRWPSRVVLAGRASA